MDGTHHSFTGFIGLGGADTTIGTYEAQLLPGLLQTEDYAREVTGRTGRRSRGGLVATVIRGSRRRSSGYLGRATHWQALAGPRSPGPPETSGYDGRSAVSVIVGVAVSVSPSHARLLRPEVAGENGKAAGQRSQRDRSGMTLTAHIGGQELKGQPGTSRFSGRRRNRTFTHVTGLHDRFDKLRVAYLADARAIGMS